MHLLSSTSRSADNTLTGVAIVLAASLLLGCGAPGSEEGAAFTQGDRTGVTVVSTEAEAIEGRGELAVNDSVAGVTEHARRGNPSLGGVWKRVGDGGRDWFRAYDLDDRTITDYDDLSTDDLGCIRRRVYIIEELSEELVRWRVLDDGYAAGKTDIVFMSNEQYSVDGGILSTTNLTLSNPKEVRWERVEGTALDEFAICEESRAYDPFATEQQRPAPAFYREGMPKRISALGGTWWKEILAMSEEFPAVYDYLHYDLEEGLLYEYSNFMSHDEDCFDREVMVIEDLSGEIIKLRDLNNEYAAGQADARVLFRPFRYELAGNSLRTTPLARSSGSGGEWARVQKEVLATLPLCEESRY